MALRKEKIKAVCEEMARAELEPGEEILVGALPVVGSGGYYGRGLSSWPFYVVVTDRRVLFIKATLFGVRPKAVDSVYPRLPGSIVKSTTEFCWMLTPTARFSVLRKPGNSTRTV